MSSSSPDPVSPLFDVRDIPCKIKHSQILQRWEALAVGEHFVLVNDHDPVPLYHQFAVTFPGAFSWDYLQRGPDEFQVKITRTGLVSVAPNARHAVAADWDPRKVLDVRPIPGRLKHARIFELWRSLATGDYFVLLNDHDPVPLKYQFAAEFPDEFGWEYLATGPDEFRVKITRFARPGSTIPSEAVSGPSESDIVEVDARGLEPPEPLMRILNALESLPSDKRLRAVTDREPCHLFGEAEQRGFAHASTVQPDGSWATLLTRQ